MINITMLNYLRYAASVSIVFFVCTGIASSISAREAKETKWRMVKEGDGIVVFSQRKKSGSRFRAVGRAKVHDLYSVVALMEDLDGMPEWMALLNETVLLKQESKNTRYIQGIVKFPIIKDRDMVVKIIISQDPKTHSVAARFTNQYDYIPTDPDYIRFLVADGLVKFDIISDTEVEITYELEANISGTVSAQVTDYLTMYAPYLTIQSLRTALQNPKYHNQEKDYMFVGF